VSGWFALGENRTIAQKKWGVSAPHQTRKTGDNNFLQSQFGKR